MASTLTYAVTSTDEIPQRGVDPEWSRRAYSAMRRWLRTHQEFFAPVNAQPILKDDQPSDLRHYGVVVARLIREGLLEPTGEFRRTPVGNDHKQVFRSTIYTPRKRR